MNISEFFGQMFDNEQNTIALFSKVVPSTFSPVYLAPIPFKVIEMIHYLINKLQNKDLNDQFKEKFQSTLEKYGLYKSGVNLIQFMKENYFKLFIHQIYTNIISNNILKFNSNSSILIQIQKNYSIVKDGFVHFRVLPTDLLMDEQIRLLAVYGNFTNIEDLTNVQTNLLQVGNSYINPKDLQKDKFDIQVMQSNVFSRRYIYEYQCKLDGQINSVSVRYPINNNWQYFQKSFSQINLVNNLKNGFKKIFINNKPYDISSDLFQYQNQAIGLVNQHREEIKQLISKLNQPQIKKQFQIKEQPQVIIQQDSSKTQFQNNLILDQNSLKQTLIQESVEVFNCNNFTPEQQVQFTNEFQSLVKYIQSNWIHDQYKDLLKMINNTPCYMQIYHNYFLKELFNIQLENQYQQEELNFLQNQILNNQLNIARQQRIWAVIFNKILIQDQFKFNIILKRIKQLLILYIRLNIPYINKFMNIIDFPITKSTNDQFIKIIVLILLLEYKPLLDFYELFDQNQLKQTLINDLQIILNSNPTYLMDTVRQISSTEKIEVDIDDDIKLQIYIDRLMAQILNLFFQKYPQYYKPYTQIQNYTEVYVFPSRSQKDKEWKQQQQQLQQNSIYQNVFITIIQIRIQNGENVLRLENNSLNSSRIQDKKFSLDVNQIKQTKVTIQDNYTKIKLAILQQIETLKNNIQQHQQKLNQNWSLEQYQQERTKKFNAEQKNFDTIIEQNKKNIEKYQITQKPQFLTNQQKEFIKQVIQTDLQNFIKFLISSLYDNISKQQSVFNKTMNTIKDITSENDLNEMMTPDTDGAILPQLSDIIRNDLKESIRKYLQLFVYDEQSQKAIYDSILKEIRQNFENISFNEQNKRSNQNKYNNFMRQTLQDHINYQKNIIKQLEEQIERLKKII